MEPVKQDWLDRLLAGEGESGAWFYIGIVLAFIYLHINTQ